MAGPVPRGFGDDRLDALVTVLDLIRSGAARTRPEIARSTGLGRNVVAPRVAQLLAAGLVEEGQLGPSTGGRAPRELSFRADAGHLLAAELGATHMRLALVDLVGRLVAVREEAIDITDGPDAILARVDAVFAELLADRPDTTVWGVGVGLPGPVEFRTGRPVAPPIMPGWDGYDVRGYFAERYAAPVWVDNDVNIMVLGELRAGLAKGQHDVVYVKIGSGIGGGLISQGRLHRGAQGCAGDIGHIPIAEESSVVCRCGKTGCLEALAGGAAIARQAAEVVAEGRSRWLSERASDRDPLTAADVGFAASHGDPVAVSLLVDSAHLVGEALARLVSVFNPSLLLIGGGVAHTGDLYLANLKQVVYSRSLPLATRSLQIVRSPLGDNAGLLGAAFMVLDELFAPVPFSRWIGRGSPAGMPQLAAA